MGRKLRFALVLALLAAAGCQQSRGVIKLDADFGDKGIWPRYVCDENTKKTAEQLLIEIYGWASAPPPNPFKDLCKVQVLRILVLPDSRLNKERCDRVMKAWQYAKDNEWLECFVELNQCN